MLNDFPVARGDRNALGRDSVDLGTDSGVLFFEPLRRFLIPLIAADISDARVKQMSLDFSGGGIAASTAPAATGRPRTFGDAFFVWVEGHYARPSGDAH